MQYFSRLSRWAEKAPEKDVSWGKGYINLAVQTNLEQRVIEIESYARNGPKLVFLYL